MQPLRRTKGRRKYSLEGLTRRTHNSLEELTTH